MGASYGQFCPVAKAMELLDERWTMLVVRELVSGSERFNDLRHLNRAGAEGWQAYDRAALIIGQPHRLHALTYSFRRPLG